jgi:hypothetical protein
MQANKKVHLFVGLWCPGDWNVTIGHAQWYIRHNSIEKYKVQSPRAEPNVYLVEVPETQLTW